VAAPVNVNVFVVAFHTPVIPLPGGDVNAKVSVPPMFRPPTVTVAPVNVDESSIISTPGSRIFGGAPLRRFS